MIYRIWYSTEGFADYIIDKTILKSRKCVKRLLLESDAKTNHFHTIPDHIKKILYLDAHDLIIEVITSKGFEPILSIEESKEAGTGHNPLQRFARLAASVENNVPTIFIYPEATIISRDSGTKKTWDKINPNIFLAMEEIYETHKIPALLFYYPTFFKSQPDPYKAPYKDKGRKEEKTIKYAGCPDSSDNEMKALFNVINKIIEKVEEVGVIDARENLITERAIRDRRKWMLSEYAKKVTKKVNSPISATTIVKTSSLIEYLKSKSSKSIKIGELLQSRKESVIYQIDGGFRGDPYPGCLATLDYIMCRNGKSFEERDKNLIICFGTLDYNSTKGTINVTDNPKTKTSTITDLTDAVKQSEKRNLLSLDFSTLKKSQIPRYYMQMRYGSTFSKVKHIRVYSYFADAIIFPDGVLWRDA
tara:strand:- start:4020 stop:5273 length:1254 start_codon:yes stop_codon:yes gene_type:complete